MLLKAFPLLSESIHPVLWAANTLSHVLSEDSSSPCRGRYELSPTAPGEENIARNTAVDLGVGDYELPGLKKPETFVSCVHECLLTEARVKARLPPGGPKSTCFHRLLTGRAVVPHFPPIPPCFPA